MGKTPNPDKNTQYQVENTQPKKMENITIIGGGGAGLTAALAAKKSGAGNVTLITKEKYSYSPCALPFVLGGEIESFSRITSPIEDICRMSGIKCILSTAESINTQKKTIKTDTEDIPYERLIIATGANPAIPPIKGANLPGVYTMQNLQDAEKVYTAMENAENAVVVGEGESASKPQPHSQKKDKSNTRRRAGIRPMQALRPRLPHRDREKHHRPRHRTHQGKFIEEITGDTKVRTVKVADREIPADMVILSTGVRPNVKILEGSGIELINGGIKTDEHCETNIKGIYAAGDCSITKATLTGKPIASLLGTTAVRQGTVAGMCAAGENAVFEGVLNSMLLKLFDQEIGRCGLTEKEAAAEGIETVTGKIRSSSNAEYYPGGKPIEITHIQRKKHAPNRSTGHRRSRRPGKDKLPHTRTRKKSHRRRPLPDGIRLHPAARTLPQRDFTRSGKRSKKDKEAGRKEEKI